jgi:hypothetical protein
MGPRTACLAILFGIALVAFPLRAAADKLAELQAEFDRESSGVRKAKLLDKLGDAQFVQTREAGKSNDYNTVDMTMEKYRDNVRSAFESLKKQHPGAERHPNGYKQLEMSLRKGIREVDDTLLVAPAEYRPPLQLVRQDLITIDDDLLRMLFPRRPGEQLGTQPAAPPKTDPAVQPPAEQKP